MTTLMSTTKKFFATTESQAKGLVEEMRNEHGSYIKNHSITKKTKKEVDYFIVSVTVEFYKDKDLVVTD